MQPPTIALEKVCALKPLLRATVPQEYADINGHMNMRWYSALFDEAGDVLHAHHGLTPEYHQVHGTGTFDLEHHIHFLGEVFPGDALAILVRAVAFTPKRFHYLMFMVNETRGKLAAIFECMNTFVDLAARKTAPFPEAIAKKLRDDVAATATLDWPPPVSGSMHA